MSHPTKQTVKDGCCCVDCCILREKGRPPKVEVAPARKVYIVCNHLNEPLQVFETRGAAIDYIRIQHPGSAFALMELPLLERWPLPDKTKNPGSAEYLFEKEDGQ